MSEFSYVYGKALFELATDELKCDEYFDELLKIDEILKENPAYINLIDTPSLSLEERQRLIDEAFSSANGNIRSFIKILSGKKSGYLLSKCIAEFKKLYDEANNIERGEVITSHPLTDAQLTRLTEKLSALLNKRVILEAKLDEKILGGVILNLKNAQYDGSIKKRLDTLCAAIKG